MTSVEKVREILANPIIEHECGSDDNFLWKVERWAKRLIAVANESRTHPRAPDHTPERLRDLAAMAEGLSHDVDGYFGVLQDVADERDGTIFEPALVKINKSTVRGEAVTEMERAGLDASDVRTMSTILAIFFRQWDSGGAVWAMVPVLEKCLRDLPLSPLTGEDDEWLSGHFEDGMSQNIRCGSVFKKDAIGKCWDIDNPKRDGTFPYSPEQRNLDPVIKVNT